MRVIHTHDEAYQLGSRYMEHIGSKGTVPTTPYNAVFPPQLTNPMWEQSMDALRNTLKYIMEFLHHQCYMLCVNDNNILMCKLDSQTTAPIFKDILEKSITPESLYQNDQITPNQSKTIQESVSKNIDKMRIMQCVVKPFSTNPEKPVSNEYLELLKGLSLPNGVFILNLTDAVILRDDGRMPFPMVMGKTDLGEYKFDKHLPIFSISGQKGYADIPIPNYDDVMFVLKTPKKYGQQTGYVQDKTKRINPDPTYKTNWDDKLLRKAVFRGGTTGCGYTDETNMRIKLVKMRSELIDAKFTSREGSDTIDSKSIRFDPKYGIGSMNTNISANGNFLSMAEQSNYKYIIHVDGNVNAYRLLATMLTGSLILRVVSPYTSWVDHLIRHREHYVPVKQDLSDLTQVIQWCDENDDKCKQMAKAGMDFARSVLNKHYIQTYIQQMMWTLSDSVSPKARTTKKNRVVKNATIKRKPATKEDVKTSKEDAKKMKDDAKKAKDDAKKTKEDAKKMKDDAKKAKEDATEYIDMPAGKNRCPTGYKSVMRDGVKVCKKYGLVGIIERWKTDIETNLE